MIQIKSIFICLFIFVSSFKEGECTNECSKFPSCNCFYLNDRTSVYCNIAGKIDKMPINFEPIGNVKLENSTNDCLPGNLFSNTWQITEIRIFCPFKCLHRESLWGMPYLELIQMRNTKFSSIPAAIATRTSPFHLKLEQGQLSIIGDGLRELVNLATLSLYHNRITHVYEYAFINNKKLESINLNNNNIMHFKSGTFRFCKDIRVFLVADNYLQNTMGLPQTTSLEVSNAYLY